MAATDQTYRKQKSLDIVFAVSSILALLSIVWMLVQDYNREFKRVQREFRDVEEAVAQRGIVDRLPPAERIEAIDETEKLLYDKKKELADESRKHAGAIRDAQADKAKADAEYQGIKANYDSVYSRMNIAQDDADRATSESRRKAFYAQVTSLAAEYDSLGEKLTKAAEKQNRAKNKLDEAEQPVKAKEAELARQVAAKMLERKLMSYSAGSVETLAGVEDNLKKATADFDRLAKLAAAKRWKLGDTIRKLPLIDAFASPTRIQQYTLHDLTIDYNFKRVTRYDRCTTCHLGIERGNFDRDSLERLNKVPSDLDAKLTAAIKLLRGRQERGEELGFDPGDIRKTAKALSLTKAQITQFAAHPRLHLFVDGNSPHAAEKFGCTICHAGQGSATEFTLAAHTPNDAAHKEEWEKQHDWEHSHFWDYPMLPNRFIESSCLQCHHQVTDLISYGSRQEAPKLLRGYNLIRENGCFGCHEISGQKSGRPVGPDLRAEPNVLPLQALTPAERNAALGDPLNPPGTLRKVGPSLYHLAEKTNEEWVRKWLRSPRGFRHDTKMPHFYGLSTNNHEYLTNEALGQEKFPDAEIHAIAYYLFHESKGYLEGKDTYYKSNYQRYTDLKKREEEAQQLTKKRDQLKQEIRSTTDKKPDDWEAKVAELRKELAAEEARLVTEGKLIKLALTEKDRKELNEVIDRLRTAGRYALLQPVLDGLLTPEEVFQHSTEELINQRPQTLAKLTDGAGHDVTDAYKKLPVGKGLARGNRLFREKGCLACHAHEATKKSGRDEFDRPMPPVASEADFGPNLSRLTAKLGNGKANPEARRWLVQWILNPKVLSPRTRMPITHLDVDEAADVADWLLSQPADWTEKDVDAPDKATLKAMVAVYFEKIMPKSEVEEFKKNGFTKDQIKQMRENKWDADELVLEEVNDDTLKWYVGKRAINRLGCFGCHAVPGFESAKPIGTPLNDWGRKDPERLAFENVEAYVKDQIYEHKKLKLVDEMTDKKGEGPKVEEGQEAYEKFFLNSLEHRQRDGFLHQKLMEPRSFDYHRPMSWDDRTRMPQFRFARGPAAKPKGEETEAQAEARSEAQAREAVMTFILGLYAEPIPFQYLHRPQGDKLAEAKGRLVLETFNCAGCHQVRAGVYEFKRTGSDEDPVVKQLTDALDAARKKNYAADHFFPDHNAWAGQKQPNADRVLIHGLPAQEDEGKLILRLTQALSFKDANNPEKDDIRAGEPIEFDDQALRGLVARAEPFGGAFPALMVPYLKVHLSSLGNNEDNALAALPPPLLREGERVQPDWLFRFLRNPGEIRPQLTRKGDLETGTVILRMPRFNMSDDDARALVNYFAAADRQGNPNLGIDYPYLKIAQQQPGYLQRRTRTYVERLKEIERSKKEKLLAPREDQLKPIFAEMLADQLAEAEKELPRAEERLKAAKKAEEEAMGDKKADAVAIHKTAEQALKDLKQDIARLKVQVKEKNYTALLEQWRKQEAYATDGYRLMTNSDVCLKCHQVGNQAGGQLLGPSLNLAAERLRPEWTLRWIARPARMTTYEPRMTVYFPNKDEPPLHQQIFPGSALDRATVSRDLLLNLPSVIALPANRYYRPGLGGTP
jgi:mono/diheme cytochrome c family protein